MSDRVIIDRYWCLTADRSRVVPETDPAARWLHWRPGDQVPRAEAERLGAVPTDAPQPEPADEAQLEAKMREQPGDKALGKPADKAAGRPDAKAVREWAERAGVEVSERGRIPDDVMDAYLQAHQEV